MPRVSIIIALYNGEKTIEETVSSLLAQTEQDVELIIVDDGSTDETVKIVKSIKDERITLLEQENSGGPSKPRNAGIKIAKGQFIGFCDQDDLYYPEKIDKQVNAYENNQMKANIGIIISSADLIDEKGQVIEKNIKPIDGFMDSDDSRKLLLKGDFITACSALMPKKVLDEVGNLDESLRGVDDYDLFLRITEKYGILLQKEPLCAWRQSEKSLSSNKNKQYLETEKIFKKLGNSEEIRIGHGRNLTRIFLSYLLEEQYKEASKYRHEAQKYSLSGKIKLLFGIFDVSSWIAFVFVKILVRVGRLSL